MSDRSGATNLFGRPRSVRPPEPKPDAKKAPYGWMFDKGIGKWRPKKRAGRTKGSPNRPAGYRRPTTRSGRKAAATPREPVWTHLPEPTPELTADEEVPEEEDLRDLDPAPAWQEQPGEPAAQPPEAVPTDMKAEIRALVALLYSIPAEPLAMVDPYCFGPLDEAETAIPIVNALTDIVCASPTVAAWAASASGLRPWIRLGIAFKPVARNVVAHHIRKTVEVEVDREKREIHVTKRDFSQYTAA